MKDNRPKDIYLLNKNEKIRKKNIDEINEKDISKAKYIMLPMTTKEDFGLEEFIIVNANNFPYQLKEFEIRYSLNFISVYDLAIDGIDESNELVYTGDNIFDLYGTLQNLFYIVYGSSAYTEMLASGEGYVDSLVDICKFSIVIKYKGKKDKYVYKFRSNLVEDMEFTEFRIYEMMNKMDILISNHSTKYNSKVIGLDIPNMKWEWTEYKKYRKFTCIFPITGCPEKTYYGIGLPPTISSIIYERINRGYITVYFVEGPEYKTLKKITGNKMKSIVLGLEDGEGTTVCDFNLSMNDFQSLVSNIALYKQLVKTLYLSTGVAYCGFEDDDPDEYFNNMVVLVNITLYPEKGYKKKYLDEDDDSSAIEIYMGENNYPTAYDIIDTIYESL